MGLGFQTRWLKITKNSLTNISEAHPPAFKKSATYMEKTPFFEVFWTFLGP